MSIGIVILVVSVVAFMAWLAVTRGFELKQLVEDGVEATVVLAREGLARKKA